MLAGQFAFANTLLQTASQKTLPLALGQFKGEHSMDMPLILAVLVIIRTADGYPVHHFPG